MEVARLQVAFEATGQQAVQSAIQKTDNDITRLGKNSEGSAKQIGSAFGGAGKMIGIAFGAVATLGIGKALSGFIGMNAQAEQFRASLETVTGSQERANELFGQLKTFAAETPFEFPELVQASVNLESFGLKTEDWITTIGDTASAMGKSVDVVTQAVLDASSGEYERLKELGVKASVEGDKLHLSYMQNGKQIVETVDKANQEVIQSTLQAIWNKKYAGAMKKQSKTFNGQLSTFKDNVKSAMMEATKPVFNFAKDGLDAANRLFSRFSDKRAMGLGVWDAAMSSLHTTLDQTFGKSAGDTIIGVIRGIGSAVGEVADRIGTLGGLLLDGDFGGFFSQLGTDLLDLAKNTVFELPSLAVKIGGWAISAVSNLYDAAKTKIMEWIGGTPAGDETGGPSISGGYDLGTVAVAVGGWLISSLDNLMTKLGTWVKSQITGPVDGGEVTVQVGLRLGLKGSIGLPFNFGQMVGEAIRSGIDAAIGPISSAVRNASWGDIGKAIVLGIAGSIVLAVASPLLLTVPIYAFIAGALKGLTFPDSSFAEIGTKIKNGIVGAISTTGDISQLLVATGVNLLAGLKTGIDQTWASIVVPGLQGVGQGSIDAVGNLAATLTPAGNTLLSGLKLGIDATWATSVVPGLNGVAQGSMDAVGDLSSTLTSAGNALLNGFKFGIDTTWASSVVPGLQGVAQGSVDAVGNLSGVLYGAGASLIQGLIDGINSMIGSLTSTLGGVTNLIPRVKGPMEKDRVLLKPSGQAIMQGLIGGINTEVPALARSLTAITNSMSVNGRGSYAAYASGVANQAGGRASIARQGAASVHHHYYDLSGAILTKDAVQFVRSEVVQGVAKEVPAALGRSRSSGRS